MAKYRERKAKNPVSHEQAVEVGVAMMKEKFKKGMEVVKRGLDNDGVFFIGGKVMEGPMKEVLQEASKEKAKLGIEAAIAAIKAEKIPSQRDTPMGRKSWALDQKKRIQELEKQLNEH